MLYLTLEPNTAYSMKVAAETSLGEGNYSQSLKVHTKGEVGVNIVLFRAELLFQTTKQEIRIVNMR